MRGYQKKVIFLKNTGSHLFDEAYFVMSREGEIAAVDQSDMVFEANRIIKESLDGKLTEKRIKHYEKILNEIANQSSICERRADEAEREVEKLKKVQYMKKFINHEFEGVISGITSWGMYVELPNTVEGMIGVASLKGDYFYYDEEKYQMIGEHTKKTFNLGQTVRVVVMNADMLTKTIDFELVEV